MSTTQNDTTGDLSRNAENPFEPLLQTPVPTETTLGPSELFSPPVFKMLLSLNITSILCSFGCVAILFCLRYQKGRIHRWRAQHVSIRLILYASLIDIFYSGFRIYDMFISQTDTGPDSQANCQAAMFGVTFFALLSVFVRALFSVHLHAVIVRRVKRPLRYERRFLVSSFFLALVLALLPLTRFSYTWVDFDPTLGSGHCSYFSLESVPRKSTTLDVTADEARKAVIAGLLYCWMTYFSWVALTILYCGLVIGAVIYRLWAERRQHMRLISERNQELCESSTANSDILEDFPNTSNSIHSHENIPPMLMFVRYFEGVELWQVAKKVLRRVAQFPATIILCHSLEVAWATATLSRIIPIVKTGVFGNFGDLKRLYMAMHIMLSLQGILTFLSLCIEPAVKTNVFGRFLRWIKSRPHQSQLKKQQEQKQQQHSSAQPVDVNRDAGQNQQISLRYHSAVVLDAFTAATVGAKANSQPPALQSLANMPWHVVSYDFSTGANKSIA